MEKWAMQAVAFGFSHAGILKADTLALREEVRGMCASGKCHQFGKNWMCPPACGSLEESRGKLAPFSQGIIVQTTAVLEDDFDYEAMAEGEKRQKALFLSFRGELARSFDRLLALSAGTCELCGTCAYPDAPCRRPLEAVSSMEAFGLVVSDVCQANGLPYYYGPGTITYTGCYLLA